MQAQSLGFLAGALVACAGLAVAQAGQAGAGRTWNFEDGKPGELAAGFEAAVGDWKIVADSQATSGKHVLAQLGSSERPIFNVALASDTRYQDLDLSVRLKAVAGEIDQGGGVVWRALDAKNYYIARYNPLENNYRVYKVVGGKRTQLATADAHLRAGWHRVRITMVGARIECYLDGERLLAAEDSSLAAPGKIGLWTKADARTHFDDLSVHSM